MKKLVLLRHGESTWNQENRFTGWTDVDLNETGIQEEIMAGRVFKSEGYIFDVAYTSVLKRRPAAGTHRPASPPPPRRFPDDDRREGDRPDPPRPFQRIP